MTILYAFWGVRGDLLKDHIGSQGDRPKKDTSGRRILVYHCFGIFENQVFVSTTVWKYHRRIKVSIQNNYKQAGAELGQAQLKLGLDLTSTSLH